MADEKNKTAKEETPRQKLSRLMGIRVTNVLTNLKNVSKLATYEGLTDEDIGKVTAIIDAQAKETFAALKARTKPESEGGFAL